MYEYRENKTLGPLMPGSSLQGLATPEWDLHPRLAETWLARACCIISSQEHRLEGEPASW